MAQQLNGDCEWRVGPLAAVAAATLPPRSDVPQENLRRGKPTRAYWLCAVKPRRANPASRPPRHFPGWSGAVASCAGAGGRVSSWRGAAGTRGTERGGMRGRASVDWRSAGRSRRAAATLNILILILGETQKQNDTTNERTKRRTNERRDERTNDATNEGTKRRTNDATNERRGAVGGG